MQDRDYTLGYLAGQLEQVIHSLEEHRREEQLVWEEFRSKLTSLENWRARVVGIAAGVSALFSVIWHYIVRG